MATSKANAADTKSTVTPVDSKATVAESTTEKKATTTKKATEAKTEVKTAAKKETVKKTAAKKPAAKKSTTAKKADTKKTVSKTVQNIEAKTVIQYSGKEITASDILETVKKIWVEKFQGKLEEIKTIEIYIKPEENKAYFVVNGLSNGDYFVEL